jgi:hypothetical protein
LAEKRLCACELPEGILPGKHRDEISYIRFVSYIFARNCSRNMLHARICEYIAALYIVHIYLYILYVRTLIVSYIFARNCSRNILYARICELLNKIDKYLLDGNLRTVFI